MSHVDEGQWLTLTEASDLTGKSIHSLRMMIRRNKLTHVKKVRGKRGEEWVVHREAIHDARQDEQDMSKLTHVNVEGEHCPTSKSEHVITLPLEYYERQQKEHDNLLQGLAMYQYKLADYERQLKLLPAPAETIAPRLQELEVAAAQVTEMQANLHDKERALARAQEILSKAREDYEQYKTSIVELKEKLQEEERVKAELRRELELERQPWWKKVFRMR